MGNLIGIDLGGTAIKAAVVTAEGTLLDEANQPFVDRDMEWARAIRDLVSGFEQKHGKASAIGLSAPGLAARSGRCISHLPGRLDGLEGLDWTDYLGRSELVPVLNDAHADVMTALRRRDSAGVRRAIEKDLFVAGQFLRTFCA